MSIQQSELKLYRAAQNSNTSSANGGIASYTEVVSGVNNNLLPDVSQAERVAGLTTFRKVFYKNGNSSDLSLLNSRVFIENYTPGDDAVYIHAGNDSGLQSALTGNEDLYGCGKLDSNVIASATTLDILIEQSAVHWLRDTDVIRISDRSTIDGSGNEEFVTVSGTPTYNGSVCTIVFTPALANGYAATNTRVANCLVHGTMGASSDTVVDTTAGNGTYDEVAQPIACTNQGTVYDTWTATFSSATAYTVVGTITGSLGAGSTNSDFSPLNPNTATPYFSIKSAGFAGTWANGDTLTFTTHPAHIPLWVKRVVPAGTPAYAGDKVVIAIDGETA